MSAAAPSPAPARGAGAAARVADVPIPILRTATVYNANQKLVSKFDVSKLRYATPARADGKTSFFKDGRDGICVPLIYDGTYAMNHGWIVRHGKFDAVESTIKGDRQVQLIAHYPVKHLSEELSAADAAEPRKSDMYHLLNMLAQVETAAKAWITADTEGRMFGVGYSAADLEPKTRVDGKLEKGKFATTIYSGVTRDGEPAYLKSYFKLPHANIGGEEALKLYCDLTINGKPVESLLPHFLEHVTWKNDVGIVLSLRDLYKSAHGIALRVRVDIVGVWEPPKPVYVPLANPFAAGSKMLEDS